MTTLNNSNALTANTDTTANQPIVDNVVNNALTEIKVDTAKIQTQLGVKVGKGDKVNRLAIGTNDLTDYFNQAFAEKTRLTNSLTTEERALGVAFASSVGMPTNAMLDSIAAIKAMQETRTALRKMQGLSLRDITALSPATQVLAALELDKLKSRDDMNEAELKLVRRGDKVADTVVPIMAKNELAIEQELSKFDLYRTKEDAKIGYANLKATLDIEKAQRQASIALEKASQQAELRLATQQKSVDIRNNGKTNDDDVVEIAPNDVTSLTSLVENETENAINQLVAEKIAEQTAND